MEIFNHIIKDEEVIGIGPLKIKYINDASSPLFMPACFFFTLHLKARDIKIETELFDKMPQNEKDKIASTKKWDESWAFYDYARNQISLLVSGEKPQPKKPAVKQPAKKTARKK